MSGGSNAGPVVTGRNAAFGGAGRRLTAACRRGFIAGRGAGETATGVFGPSALASLQGLRRTALVQPRDQRRQEPTQHRRPFGVLGTAGGVAEIAVELEIARLDAGSAQRLDDIARDLWWKKRIGAAQDVEHLGLDPGEFRPRVKAEQRAAQNDQRVGVPFDGPVRGLLADRRLARRRVRETRRHRRDRRPRPDGGHRDGRARLSARRRCRGS